MSQSFDFNADSFKMLSIEIFPCFVTNRPDCLGKPAFLEILDSFYSTFNYGIAELYILNTGFNVDKKDHITRHLDANHWLTFSDHIGTDLIVQIGSYQVETDTTMMPIEIKENEQGHFIS